MCQLVKTSEGSLKYFAPQFTSSKMLLLTTGGIVIIGI